MQQNPKSEIVQDFDKENLATIYGRVRLSCLIATPLFLLFSFMDYLQERELFPLFVYLRLIEATLLGGIFWVTSRGELQRNSVLLGIFVWTSLGVTLTLMISMAESFGHMYTQGLFLVLIAVSLIMPWKASHSAVTMFLVYGSYVSTNASTGRLEDVIFVNNNMFLLTIAVLSVTSTYISYKLRLNDFRSRRELAKANTELEASRRKLEVSYQKLRELNELKDKFFANITHELRTPLTLILTPAEMMDLGELGPITDQQKHYLGVIQQNSVRLLKMVNDLLDLAKIDAGRMQMYYGMGSIETVAREVLETARPLAEKNRVQFLVSVAEPIPDFYFDRDKMEKVLTNLVFNALKFTDKEGRIEVELRREDDWVRVTVRDNGIGIPEQLLSVIFERFSQVDADNRRKHGGTGIGLALVKEFMELQNGTVSVESRAGAGAAFHLRLPFLLTLDESATPDRRKITREIERKQRTTDWKPKLAPRKLAGKAKILVAEDNADLRSFIIHQLSDSYMVVSAIDGSEALTLANRELPDLVISDCMMPEKDGFQLCRELKSGLQTSHIPIILITAYPENQHQGVLCGADAFLMKPFKVNDLRDRVRTLLKR